MCYCVTVLFVCNFSRGVGNGAGRPEARAPGGLRLAPLSLAPWLALLGRAPGRSGPRMSLALH